jgi:hypothetical protein
MGEKGGNNESITTASQKIVRGIIILLAVLLGCIIIFIATWSVLAFFAYPHP